MNALLVDRRGDLWVASDSGLDRLDRGSSAGGPVRFTKYRAGPAMPHGLMRPYLRSCLRSPGVEVGRVLEAADGLEALRLARAGGVNLVISDIVVPGLDGRALCRAIREIPGSSMTSRSC